MSQFYFEFIPLELNYLILQETSPSSIPCIYNSIDFIKKILDTKEFWIQLFDLLGLNVVNINYYNIFDEWMICYTRAILTNKIVQITIDNHLNNNHGYSHHFVYMALTEPSLLYVPEIDKKEFLAIYIIMMDMRVMDKMIRDTQIGGPHPPHPDISLLIPSDKKFKIKFGYYKDNRCTAQCSKIYDISYKSLLIILRRLCYYNIQLTKRTI